MGEKIRCMICGRKQANLASHINIVHEIPVSEYRARFPDAEIYVGGKAFNKESKLHKQIRERDNHSCQWCGVKEAVSLNILNRKLLIHHIDDSSNNDLKNLILLCVFCHRKVHTLMRNSQTPEVTIEDFASAYAKLWPTDDGE